MSKIEAIVVDGVRYDKVRAKTEFVCEECELGEVCENREDFFAWGCKAISSINEIWKRKE